MCITIVYSIFIIYKLCTSTRVKTWQSRPKNYLAAKMESGHQVGLGILKFRILFTLMFTYMKFVDFVITILKTTCLN